MGLSNEQVTLLPALTVVENKLNELKLAIDELINANVISDKVQRESQLIHLAHQHAIPLDSLLTPYETTQESVEQIIDQPKKKKARWNKNYSQQWRIREKRIAQLNRLLNTSLYEKISALHLSVSEPSLTNHLSSVEVRLSEKMIADLLELLNILEKIISSQSIELKSKQKSLLSTLIHETNASNFHLPTRDNDNSLETSSDKEKSRLEKNRIAAKLTRENQKQIEEMYTVLRLRVRENINVIALTFENLKISIHALASPSELSEDSSESTYSMSSSKRRYSDRTSISDEEQEKREVKSKVNYSHNFNLFSQPNIPMFSPDTTKSYFELEGTECDLIEDLFPNINRPSM